MTENSNRIDKESEEVTILESIVDGFFRETSKYSAGLIGIERFQTQLKAGRDLQFAINKGSPERTLSLTPSPVQQKEKEENRAKYQSSQTVVLPTN